uniref:Uncharacterized protein n=1 Tax=Romanomermis culicivorax TaxID=13658 RepID=A0A915IT00_ROMCU
MPDFAKEVRNQTRKNPLDVLDSHGIFGYWNNVIASGHPNDILVEMFQLEWTLFSMSADFEHLEQAFIHQMTPNESIS